MTLWLVAQICFAAAAWTFAARTVFRVALFAGVAHALPATIRDLRRARRADELPKLALGSGVEPISDLLEIDADHTSAEQLVSAAQQAASQAVPPVRLLRSVATVGTMLGLLAAVATLRSGLDLATTRAMESAANGAFDSAVLGFVTALPCWTAVSLSRRAERRGLNGLDRVVLAMRAEPEPT